jgi:hypothetical protein
MSMEFEFERGPSGRTISQAGDIWIIQAQQRHAALVEGRTVEFCEMRVPTRLFGDRPLETQIGHRDPFLVALIDRMSTAIGGDGVAARLLTESLATTIQLCPRHALVVKEVDKIIPDRDDAEPWRATTRVSTAMTHLTERRRDARTYGVPIRASYYNILRII